MAAAALYYLIGHNHVNNISREVYSYVDGCELVMMWLSNELQRSSPGTFGPLVFLFVISRAWDLKTKPCHSFVPYRANFDMFPCYVSCHLYTCLDIDCHTFPHSLPILVLPFGKSTGDVSDQSIW